MPRNGKRPRMRALEAFEAVSRHQSISKAADELGVTQSAVSHQLRHLTEEIGEKLVAKSGRKIVLSDAGRQLAATIQGAFNEIDRSVAAVIGVDRSLLRLAVCSSFAPGWLIKRLHSFYPAHPQIDLQLKMYAQDPELTDAVADAFVTTLPKQPGFWALHLLRELLIPVLAAEPAIKARGGRVPLITTTLDPVRIGDDWGAYCELANLPIGELHTGAWLYASHYVMAFDMARAGLGMALVPDFLAEDEIKAGRLRTLAPQKLPTHQDYYLCVKNSRRDEPKLQALIRWAQSKAALPNGEEP